MNTKSKTDANTTKEKSNHSTMKEIEDEIAVIEAEMIINPIDEDVAKMFCATHHLKAIEQYEESLGPQLVKVSRIDKSNLRDKNRIKELLYQDIKAKIHPVVELLQASIAHSEDTAKAVDASLKLIRKKMLKTRFKNSSANAIMKHEVHKYQQYLIEKRKIYRVIHKTFSSFVNDLDELNDSI